MEEKMNNLDLIPENDGVTHINMYSKARTKYGLMLSNFYHFPIETPDGSFESVEGYWAWLSVSECPEREQLCHLYGYLAKKVGKELIESKGKRFDDDFEHKILSAIEYKFRRNANLLTAEWMQLPIVHYYAYGKDGNYKVYDLTAKYQWMIDGMMRIRDSIIKDCINEFVMDAAKEFDWTMPTYDSDEQTYDEYENECMDIGHDYTADVAAIAKERIMKAHKLPHSDKYDEIIEELTWDIISKYILTNMNPNNTEVS
jgi:hypothetical protein